MNKLLRYEGPGYIEAVFDIISFASNLGQM